ncbi:MAG: F0F1 ATP synthase subunit A [Bacteroidetes bacterium]|uniref:ATP synthase subunit a n=1 Tax=Candidatus Cryptobacteroides merdigallinarum TaxID=2840770 RepID=A0A9D9EML9_9BACT|nr:F0F1 ATP synthase subunit A [Candidatus Cryptobacteroides merdigallinarum]
MKRTVRYIIPVLTLLMLWAPAFAAGSGDGGKDIDIKSMLFGHIGDSYGWHVTKIGDKEITIPLPVIVKSSTGWHCFLSSRLEEGPVDGLYVAEGGKHDGKIVEKDAAGNEVRPIDISITKNVAGLMINSIIVVLLILGCSRWYRKHDVLKEAPTGIAAVIEPVVSFINDDVIKGSIPAEHSAKYAPYLLTAFFFILVNNLMGIVPVFPGGANTTGNIAVTLTLALLTFLIVNIFANRHYWKDIFWPDVPWWLKAPVPLIPLTELLGIFTKPFALMIRLFANIMAGHAVILSFVSIIFLTVKMGPAVNGTMSFVAVLFGIFMDFLELLVAFIQAYVFTMLSAVFIGLAHVKAEPKDTGQHDADDENRETGIIL